VTAPLTDQIRDYFADADRRQGAVDVGLIVAGRVVATDVVLEAVVGGEQHRHRTRWVVGVSAAAVVALVAAGLIVRSAGDDDDQAPATDLSSIDSSTALATANNFITLANAGDIESVMALFAPDATFTDIAGSGPGTYRRDDFTMMLEWHAAQATQIIDVACSIAGTSGGAASVSCEAGAQEAITRAAGRDPVPITLQMTIGSDGIREWIRVIGQPDFIMCCQDFIGWVNANHPEDRATIDFGNWTSVAEARASGQLIARLAEEWAVTLEPADDPPTSDDTQDAPDAPPTTPPITAVNLDPSAADPSGFVLERAAQAITPSAVGDLRWTVVSGPGDALGGIVKAPSGYAAIDDQGRFLVSDDAVEWLALPAPFPGRLLSLSQDSNGAYVMMVVEELGPRRLLQEWQSADLVAWELVDDEAVLSKWVDRSDDVIADIGDRTVMPDGSTLAQATWVLDFERIARQIGGDELQRHLDTGLTIRFPTWLPSNSDPRSGTVSVALYDDDQRIEEPRDPGVEFRLTISGSPDDWVVVIEDPNTREQLGSISGSVGAGDLADTLVALVGANVPPLSRFLVLADGNVELVADPPWFDPTGATGPIGDATIDGALLTWVRSDEDQRPAPTHVWRTTDGRSWESLGETAGWPDAPSGSVQPGPGGGLVATFWHEQGQLTVLTSDNGLDWRPASEPPTVRSLAEDPGSWPTPSSWVHATGSGLLLAVVTDPGPPFPSTFELWASADGDVWKPVDVGDLVSAHQPVPPEGATGWSGGGGRSTSKNMIEFGYSIDGGTGTWWLIELSGG
jgi:hypothetical protein